VCLAVFFLAHGILPKSKEKFGIYVEILEDSEELVCEVKRKGLC
jgi:hypothetical protein